MTSAPEFSYPLEIERIPLGNGLGDRLRIELAAQQLLHPRLQVRQTEVR